MQTYNQGSALASVLMVTAASLVTLSMFLSLVVDLRNDSILIRRKLVLAQVREQITDLIKNDTSWQAIIKPSANASFTCLKNPALGCLAGGSDLPGFIPFQLMRADGQAAFPPPSRGPGFTEQGEPCSGASAVVGSGSDACPFAILARWKRDCGPLAPCQNAYAEVRVDFVHNPRTVRPGIAINMNNFSLKTIRSHYTGNILALGKFTLSSTGDSQGYDAAQSAYYVQRSGSMNLYVPQLIESATLHLTATGTAAVDSGAEGDPLVAAGFPVFIVRSTLCAIFEKPLSQCLTTPSVWSALDSSAMTYNSVAKTRLPIASSAVLVRPIVGQTQPQQIRGLFRSESFVPQANAVRPQLGDVFIEYTVYR